MELLSVILLMGLVTFIPRFIPVLILERWTMPSWMERWLQAVPYAALGALIFPGILLVDADRPWVGIAGGLVAGLFAWLRFPLLVVIIGAILTVMGINLFV